MVNKNIAHILGIVAVLGFLVFLVAAGRRDEFPGRRQGGGSRGAVPTQLISPEICVTAGCEPLE